MKTVLLISISIMFLCLKTYSQTYKSGVAIDCTPAGKIEEKERTITISEKEISISKFFTGGETLYLNVISVENKKYVTYGICKTYYCTTRDKDPEKATVVVQPGMNIWVVLFMDDITFIEYQYQL